uniref:CABIT domain-containing protein n=1 Tax=Glossina palpalis gambiensis TaxID=67801 RepID=A0A1B0BPQ5_9MUSC
MAATDGQIILAASRFGDTTTSPPIYLRDFSKQKLPAVAKIVKGQHQNLGVPTLSAPSLQSTALFLSAGKKYQILAQPIKLKEGRKPTNVGAKLLIPETYPGYFELLSEDGRSTRCIESVLELSKRRNCRVLVRETFRCPPINRTLHAGELLTTVNENGKFLQCKNIKDEIINLPLDTKAKFSPIAKEDSISGVHTVKNLLLKRMPIVVRLVHGSVPKGLKQPFVAEMRLLGCVEIDRVFALPLQKDNDLVPVPLNAKIKLQRAKNMEQLENFIEYSRFLEKAQRLLGDARDRLQVVDIKLSEKEKKDSKFSGRNKLPVVMLPSAAGVAYVANGLMENGYILKRSASCDSYSKNQPPEEISEEYNDIDHIYDYLSNLVVNHYQHSHIQEDIKPVPPPIETIPGKKLPEKRQRPTLPKLYLKNSYSAGSSSNSHAANGGAITSIASTNGNHHHHHHHHSHHSPSQAAVVNATAAAVSSHHHHAAHHGHHPSVNAANKVLTPNNHHHTPLNGNVAPLSAGILGKDCSLEPQSPLFHIRYKSLSSLQLTPDSNSVSPPISTNPKGQPLLAPPDLVLKCSNNNNNNHNVPLPLSKSSSTNGGLTSMIHHNPREGTLDSSRSGGRTSGDSNKLPEKKTRRLSRPRSLSNLVWDLRPTKEKSKKKLYIHHFDHRQQATLYL